MNWPVCHSWTVYGPVPTSGASNLASAMVLYVSLPQMCLGMIGMATWSTRSDGSSVVTTILVGSVQSTFVTPASFRVGSR